MSKTQTPRAAKNARRQAKPFWIKERYNPQLGTYYVAMGQMSISAAKEYETGSLYGSNIMLRFDTESDYNSRITSLKSQGEKVL